MVGVGVFDFLFSLRLEERFAESLKILRHSNGNSLPAQYALSYRSAQALRHVPVLFRHYKG
jgi:hypothetical protein